MKDKGQTVHGDALRCTVQILEAVPRASTKFLESSRCLSCNRTFDDVVKTSGALSVQRCGKDACVLEILLGCRQREPEKQRAQAAQRVLVQHLIGVPLRTHFQQRIHRLQVIVRKSGKLHEA